mmetsp:Transcript_54419/g.129291  ORF Transcript_54419/g.129291 Transcript_54419/m.129291 type:complete len:234 (+) Transcript_54419:329-1030(+)
MCTSEYLAMRSRVRLSSSIILRFSSSSPLMRSRRRWASRRSSEFSAVFLSSCSCITRFAFCTLCTSACNWRIWPSARALNCWASANCSRRDCSRASALMRSWTSVCSSFDLSSSRRAITCWQRSKSVTAWRCRFASVSSSSRSCCAICSAWRRCWFSVRTWNSSAATLATNSSFSRCSRMRCSLRRGSSGTSAASCARRLATSASRFCFATERTLIESLRASPSMRSCVVSRS